jgi:Uma2 family endonuclease
MSVASDHFGPYTAEDLHAQPERGKRLELVDGWLIDLAPSAPHNLVVDALLWIVKSAARAAGADLHVSSEMDISTPSGVRRPDIVVINGKAARAAARLGRSTFYGGDVRLAVEVVSRGSGSEREDRVRKPLEYAKAGIPHYWIVDFEPDACVHAYVLAEGGYRLDRTVGEGKTLEAADPIPVSFDPAALVAWKRP